VVDWFNSRNGDHHFESSNQDIAELFYFLLSSADGGHIQLLAAGTLPSVGQVS
jgi:hypothetical protein